MTLTILLGSNTSSLLWSSWLSLMHMDNCAAMVDSSSVLQRFTGTGVSGDSGAIAALQSAPLAPAVRMWQPRILAKSDLKDANCMSGCWLRIDLADIPWPGSFKPLANCWQSDLFMNVWKDGSTFRTLHANNCTTSCKIVYTFLAELFVAVEFPFYNCLILPTLERGS